MATVAQPRIRRYRFGAHWRLLCQFELLPPFGRPKYPPDPTLEHFVRFLCQNLFPIAGELLFQDGVWLLRSTERPVYWIEWCSLEAVSRDDVRDLMTLCREAVSQVQLGVKEAYRDPPEGFMRSTTDPEFAAQLVAARKQVFKMLGEDDDHRNTDQAEA